ncbi:TIGR03619 family F420-dependent LLM class oxidoreductase [Streptomyces sp. NPDC088725]|uniref:TIGR03619 family F420-dependent LLM class oxidoreductase n=1 Tax=Streptomyces sp. NPDC088725 TaxID=3365873 RepID=UPI00381D70FB
MRIGFTLPQMGTLAHHAAGAGRFAREAEALGADSLWVSDRLLSPVRPAIGYGGGIGFPKEFNAVLDPLTVLTVAAASTERALLGSNVLAAPWYQPVLFARTLTSLDLVSGGRLIPGLGTGWSPDEFRAVGVPIEERGARLDETLDVLDAWWSTNPVAHEGPYVSLPPTHVDLKPVRRPRPPIHLGGWAPAALRRVARRADGWLPVLSPRGGYYDPASVNGPLREIRRIAAEEGRDPSEIGAILRFIPTRVTTVEEVAEAIGLTRRETDIDHVFVDLMWLSKDIDHSLELVRSVLDLARED